MKFVIINVGNELLSGDTVNTNASYMAKRTR
jgi:molybdopterin-biosynthesis enzyme MoeA-like protein